MRARARTSPWTRRLLAVTVVVAALGGVAFWPATTRQGVNYQVSIHRLPLYAKASEFVERSAQYRQLADDVMRGVNGDEARALAAFAWTCRTIKPMPAGVAVIDDHIANIVSRGYGTGDQQADVFATIATYGGVRSFWARVPMDRSTPGMILSFAHVDGAWRVFDVARHVAFRTSEGRLATLDAVRTTPSLVPDALRALTVDGASYVEVLAGASMPPVPDVLRAEMQMPMPRLWHEFQAVLGLTSQS